MSPLFLLKSPLGLAILYQSYLENRPCVGVDCNYVLSEKETPSQNGEAQAQEAQQNESPQNLNGDAC